MTEAVVIVLAAVGLAFSLSGAVGILRMPDLYTRLQCSGKTITMGAVPALVALAVGEGPLSNYGARAMLVAVLLLVLSPVAAHALARAAYKAGVPMWPGAAGDEVAARRRGTPESSAGGSGR
ncbi:MAG TPA: monovalent cation/H(+) antiporter subunit G [Pseudonocardiaceae bacterium]|nr:monovalent cation/H(+) antiporter subunit G [Pseudonocardiaceae bacterium]